MSHSNRGGQKETNLLKGLDYTEIRIIDNRSSKVITKEKFASASKQSWIDEGFLTSDDLPVAVSQLRFYREVTAVTGLTLSDSVIGADTSSNDVTINLVTATSAFDGATNKGQFFTVKNITSDAFKVTIATNGGDLIDGEASLDLTGTAFPTITFMANSATTWIVI